MDRDDGASGLVGRRALITGITSQDGAYLAALLLDRGYEVTGVLRPGGTERSQAWRLSALGIDQRLSYLSAPLSDPAAVASTLDRAAPHEIYHLAALSSVQASFQTPAETFTANATTTTHLLECIRVAHPRTRFYHASSSEMFGDAPLSPQREDTPFRPRSPYAVAKVAAHQMTMLYRLAFGLYCVNGILYNHDSPLRSPEFVTRKIVNGLCRWSDGDRAPMRLGDLDARRDWGFAGDYVRGMWLMMRADTPEDYVLATGRTWRVRDFVDLTADALGLRLCWEGVGLEERAIDLSCGKTCLIVDPALFRPAEVGQLCGDSRRARESLGWSPEVGLPELVAMMVEAERSGLQSAASRVSHISR